MTTLADVALSVAEILGGLETGIATGGSTSTLVDTTARSENMEYWKGGTLFVTSGANLGLATRINSFSESTMTFTTVTSAIVAGVTYSALPQKYPFSMLINAIRFALQGVGDTITTDATLVVLADTVSYTLPTGVSNVHRVEVATSDASPYDYSINYFWHESNGVLYFDNGKEPQDAGMKIRVWYRSPHAAPTAFSSAIANTVNLEWLKWATAVNVYRDYLSRVDKDEPIVIEFLNQAMQNEKNLKDTMIRHSTILQSIDPKVCSW